MLNRHRHCYFHSSQRFPAAGKPVLAQTYNTPLPKVNDKDVQLLRQDLRAKAKQLITKNMQLTDEQAASLLAGV